MQKGFTLVEILVSMAIIVILSTIGVEVFYTSKTRAQLQSDIAKVYSAIRTTQNRALAPSKNDLGLADTDILCSMGVSFKDTNKIQPFYTSTTSNCGSVTSTDYGSPIILDQATFSSPQSIEFTTPFATKINPSNSSVITLSINDFAVGSTITVTNAGLIQIQ